MKSTQRNHLLSLSVAILFSLLFAASLGERKATKVMLEVPVYSYIPDSKKDPGSANINLLLINPQYAKDFEYLGVKLFSDFSKSMSADINQALTDKGYYIRGPYDSYDEVVYGDKKETDLMLEIQIIPDVNVSNVHTNRSIEGYQERRHYVYTFDGEIILSGKVNLTVSEPMTKQKMWVKSIPLEQRSVVVGSTVEYPDTHLNTALTNDPGFVNPMVNVMEDYYKTVLKTAWVHLDPTELQPLKKSVEEIRKNSNLIQH